MFYCVMGDFVTIYFSKIVYQVLFDPTIVLRFILFN